MFPREKYTCNAADVVKKFLGVPYKHHGRDLSGLDCWGLIIQIYQLMGKPILDINEDYDHNWSFRGSMQFIDTYYKAWDRVQQPRFLDLVGFLNSRGVANHAGVMLNETEFIHTCRAGTVVNDITSTILAPRLAGYYRLKDASHS